MFSYMILTFVGLGCVTAYSAHGGYSGLSYGSAFAAPAYGQSYGQSYGHYEGPYSAAVHSRRTHEVIPVPTVEEPAKLTQINVDGVFNPVAIKFVSKSSPVLIDQVHIPGEPGRHQETHSQEEPHTVVHTVTRPVIQEVREVIQPYRRVQQEIRPVLEEINTVVAKGTQRAQVVEPVAVAAPAVIAAPAVTVAEAPIAIASPVAFAAQPALVETGAANAGFAFGSLGHSGHSGHSGYSGAIKVGIARHGY